jgi:hypothetical protein
MTYYDSNFTTAAPLTFDVSAVAFGGGGLAGFTPSCHAEDISVRVSYTTSGQDTTSQTLKAKRVDGDELGEIIAIYSGTPNHTDNFTFDINKSNFTTPTITRTIALNYNRLKTKALEPIYLNISDINVTTKTTGISQHLSKTAQETNFYYARAYAPDQSVTGDTLDALVTYEVYCKNCTKSTFTEIDPNYTSLSAPYWYRISDTDPLLSFSNTEIVYSGVTVQGTPTNNNIKLKATKIPHSNRIKYKPTGYLLYNMFNSSATKHNFNVSFSSFSTKWSGKGDLGSKVDMNVSNRSRSIQQMDW